MHVANPQIDYETTLGGRGFYSRAALRPLHTVMQRRQFPRPLAMKNSVSITMVRDKARRKSSSVSGIPAPFGQQVAATGPSHAGSQARPMPPLISNIPHPPAVVRYIPSRGGGSPLMLFARLGDGAFQDEDESYRLRRKVVTPTEVCLSSPAFTPAHPRSTPCPLAMRRSRHAVGTSCQIGHELCSAAQGNWKKQEEKPEAR